MDLAPALQEALPHSGRHLAIGHLVDGLDADDAPAESFLFKTLLQLLVGF